MWGFTKNIGRKTWEMLTPKKPKNDNQNRISFFDVKELYEAAYAEKAKARVNIKRFRKLLTKAALMDICYRAQMSKKQPFEYGSLAS